MSEQDSAQSSGDQVLVSMQESVQERDRGRSTGSSLKGKCTLEREVQAKQGTSHPQKVTTGVFIPPQARTDDIPLMWFFHLLPLRWGTLFSALSSLYGSSRIVVRPHARWESAVTTVQCKRDSHDVNIS